MLEPRITRANASAEERARTEFWIGEVEQYGGDWAFVVLGSDTESVESFVFSSRGAAERARATMFTVLGVAVAVVVENPTEG